MATKKKATKAKRRRRTRYRRFLQRSPAQRAWLVWNHDLDTFLHELIKNPAMASIDPKEIVARAEAFADAVRELQDRRRPAGVPKDDYGYR